MFLVLEILETNLKLASNLSPSELMVKGETYRYGRLQTSFL
jgi:hypothetical protein